MLGRSCSFTSTYTERENVHGLENGCMVVYVTSSEKSQRRYICIEHASRAPQYVINSLRYYRYCHSEITIVWKY